MARTDWWDLPGTVRAAVEAYTGPVEAVEWVVDGLTCSMAAVLTTAAGRVFVKGAPEADAEAVAAQSVEVAVNELVRPVSPRLLWRVTAAGWDVLGFDHVPGRHADLARAEDRRLVADALAGVQGVHAQAGVPPLADRFAAVLDPGQLALLDGGSLLHTDTNPHNLLVDAGRAWLVDWAMPAAGPAWVDVAYTAVRLMEADVPVETALGWAAGFPSWRAADPAAVEAFVIGSCRAWEAVVGAERAGSSNARFRVLLGAWAPARDGTLGRAVSGVG